MVAPEGLPLGRIVVIFHEIGQQCVFRPRKGDLPWMESPQ